MRCLFTLMLLTYPLLRASNSIPMQDIKEPYARRDFALEFKAGYFFPIADSFRKIYTGSGIYSLEGDFQFSNPFCLFGGLDYYTESSHIQGNSQYTCSVNLIKPYFGAKYRPRFLSPIRPYLGVAFQGGCVINNTNDPYLNTHQIGWGPGLLAIGGLTWSYKHFLLDLSGNYSWLVTQMENPQAKQVTIYNQNLSGFALQGGIGYTF